MQPISILIAAQTPWGLPSVLTMILLSKQVDNKIIVKTVFWLYFTSQPIPYRL
jgi:hypothetical protein